MAIAPEDSPYFIGGMAASTVDDASEHWVGGDGGPLVLLQSSAAAKWQGSLGSEDDWSSAEDDVVEINAEEAHLYPPEEIGYESDSDAAFLGGDYLLRRYDRDMLVFEDSEWSGRLFVLPSGAVGIVQVQCIIENLPEVIQQVLQGEPERSGVFQMEDDSLKLVVAADTETDRDCRSLSISFAPGIKQWKRYEFDLGWIHTLE